MTRGVPRGPTRGGACRAAARAPRCHHLSAVRGPLAAAARAGCASPRAGLSRQPGSPTYPAPTRAPASAVSLPPRAAAAFGRLPDSSRLHAQPDFKNKQAPPLPRDARRASASSRLPRLGTLLEGPRRDVRAVTPRSRRRSLGAPRACGVRLRIALPPCVESISHGKMVMKN